MWTKQALAWLLRCESPDPEIAYKGRWASFLALCLAGVVRQSLAMFQGVAESQGVNLRVERLNPVPVRGDRHVYASRTRFIPEALLPLFERTFWPRAEAAGRAASQGPRIDIAARMRERWR